MNVTTRIAIADDHKLIRAGIRLILNEHPSFEVVQEASNGRELINGLAESNPDVILLDMEMPILSGPDTLREIRSKNKEIPVLILTMHNNEAFILQMMELGANGYLIKNTEPKEVIEAISKVIKSKYFFTEEVSKAMLRGISDPNLKSKENLSSHNLTNREIDVLRLICKELTTVEIGQTLFLSPKTIEGYRKVLLDKTEAKNMAGLVLFAVKHGIHKDPIN
ncbi:MAG: response regulator transcription factor [Saprospiraceae bacterium]|nr:response regulator transcription factor [Saprospiraceae bacterium]